MPSNVPLAIIILHYTVCGERLQACRYCYKGFVEILAELIVQRPVLFLSELEEVLEATQPAEFQRCMVPLFRQIACCLSSSHFQVAERALYLWNNDHIENLIRRNRKAILPIVFPAMEKNGRNHWNQVVQNLTLNVRKIFSETDPELFEECLRNFQGTEAKVKELKTQHDATWKRLEEIVATKSASSEAVVPSMISKQTSSS